MDARLSCAGLVAQRLSEPSPAEIRDFLACPTSAILLAIKILLQKAQFVRSRLAQDYDIFPAVVNALLRLLLAEKGSPELSPFFIATNN